MLWRAFLVYFHGELSTRGVLARFGVWVGSRLVKGFLRARWLVEQLVYVVWVDAGWFGWVWLRGTALREVLQRGLQGEPTQVGDLYFLPRDAAHPATHWAGIVRSLDG